MITKRMLTLQAVVVVGLGSVFCLPRQTRPSEAGISLKLPGEVGIWTSKEQAISSKELTILSKDTSFSRRLYTNPFGDEVLVSIVLSGEDMNNSIHRPERCLPAQGWTIEHTERDNVPIGNNAKPLETTQLQSVRDVPVSQTQRVTLHNVQYYWFIGSRDMTASHLRRTMIDVQDRLLRGENQRWAYVTIASNVTDNLRKFGRSEPDTAKMLEEFIGQIVPKLEKPDGSAATTLATVASR